MLKETTLTAALLLAASAACAQDEAQAEQPPAPELPWIVGDNMQMKWELEDPDLREVMNALLGSFESAETSYTPEGGVHFHAAPILVEGLDNAAFFEIHRSDDPANSFRFGVIHAYRNEGKPRLRFFDFDERPEPQGPALSGLWLAPYAFPTLALDDLRPAFDIELNPSDWSGKTPHPYPTTEGGAVELTSEFSLAPQGFSVADRGYDASGKQVWGVPEGQMIQFTRFEPEATVTTTEEGLIILDIVDPDDAVALESGGEIAVHYTGYLPDGKFFDTSRQEGRGAFRVQIPGRLIQGWNQGLIGLEVGGRRRLVIPPHLGYGEQGVRGVIPPDSVLIFDVEGMWIKNPGTADEAEPGQDQGAGGVQPEEPSPEE